MLRVEVGNCFHPFLEEMKTLSIVTITAMILLQQVIAANLSHSCCIMKTEDTQELSSNILSVKLNDRQLKNFWSKVSKESHPKGCWEWTASHIRGYGQFGLNYKMFKAHRVAYLIHHGQLDLNLLVCHTCDNPKCCNPAHLWQGTNGDNSADRDAKGRQAKGDRSGARLHPERLVRGDAHWAHQNPEKCRRGDNHPRRLRPELCKRGSENPATKLTQEQVLEIRSLRGTSQQKVARKFGVSQALVSAIIRREIWSHI